MGLKAVQGRTGFGGDDFGEEDGDPGDGGQEFSDRLKRCHRLFDPCGEVLDPSGQGVDAISVVGVENRFIMGSFHFLERVPL